MTAKQFHNGNSGAAESKRTAGDLVDKKRLTVKSVHMSINFASSTGKTSKTPPPIIQEVGSTRIDTTLFNTSQDSLTPRTSTWVFTYVIHLLLIYPSFTLFPFGHL